MCGDDFKKNQGGRKMRFLQIGLGSMGKRRIRCLKRLGYEDIVGFDLRDDRRKEVKEKYNIETIKDIQDLDFDKVDIFVVSTPPDKHDEYIELAIKKQKPAFVEASVILGKLEELNKLSKERNIFIAPSCTMKFHPGIKCITDIVNSKKYGKVTNFTYHCGQYLPDWHPNENVKDYYVSKKETGAAKEIVPFELTWIVSIMGFPENIKGFYGKTMDIGANIDDTYTICVKFKNNSYGSITVDVVSRYATRSLILNMEYGQILWRWDERVVKLYEASSQKWINFYYPKGESMEGYNKNIIEDMYVDEIKSFIEAIENEEVFPNSLDEDIKILKLLNKIETDGK